MGKEGEKKEKRAKGFGLKSNRESRRNNLPGQKKGGARGSRGERGGNVP